MMLTIKGRIPCKIPVCNVVGRGGRNVPTLVQPRRQVTHAKKIVPRSSPLPIETATYLVGKGIILFTMFYCGLNWLYYKELNKKNDEH